MIAYLESPTCWFLLAGSFLLTLVLTPLIIRLARRWKVVDAGGYRKIHRKVVPLLGGLAIAVPFLFICMVIIAQPTSMLSMLVSRHDDVVKLAICSLMVLAIGVVDDVLGLDAKYKFLAQFAIAFLFCLSDSAVAQVVELPWYGRLDLGPWFGTALTMFWLVGLMNAFNLVDGVDGLAASLALISAAGLGVIAAMSGATYVVVLSLALVGSLCAFLIFNFHPAKIFLGDAGSLFLGFVLSALALGGASRGSGAVMLVAPLMVLALPIFDTLTSMARRILRGHDPFFGDRRHTHHRLLRLGLSQRQVALLMGGVSLLCTIAAIFAQTFESQRREYTAFIGIAAAALIGVAWLNGYLRLRHAMRLMHCRGRNSRLSALSNYAIISLSSSNGHVPAAEVLDLTCKEVGLDFLELRDARKDRTLWRFENNVDRMDEDRPEVVESLQVQGPAGNPLLIQYRLAHHHSLSEFGDEVATDEDRLEHEDVAACLVRLFSKADLARLIEPGAPPISQLRQRTFIPAAAVPRNGTYVAMANEREVLLKSS